jgi:hypothetical protein
MHGVKWQSGLSGWLRNNCCWFEPISFLLKYWTYSCEEVAPNNLDQGIWCYPTDENFYAWTDVFGKVWSPIRKKSCYLHGYKFSGICLRVMFKAFFFYIKLIDVHVILNSCFSGFLIFFTLQLCYVYMLCLYVYHNSIDMP